MLYDAMSEIVMNKAILEVEMPIAVSGSDKIDSEVVFPSSVVTFKDKDTKVTPLMPSSNLSAGFNALRETEKSITEGSVNETLSGQLPEASQKAFSVAQAASNSKKLIGAVGKSLAESIIQYGDLMKDIILNHITIPQVEELVTGGMKLKYRSFLLEKKGETGMSSKRIKFDESLIGKEMSPEELKRESVKMAEDAGYPNNETTLIRINPSMFARFKYLTNVDVEEMFSKNQEYWQPILMSLKQALANDPSIKQEKLTEKLLYAFFQSGASELMKDQSEMMMPGVSPDIKTTQFGQQAVNKALANASNMAVQ
jgi:hypothetical protein